MLKDSPAERGVLHRRYRSALSAGTFVGVTLALAAMLFNWDLAAHLGALWSNASATRLAVALAVGFLIGAVARLIAPWLLLTTQRAGIRRVAFQLPVLGKVDVGLDDARERAAWRLHVELTTRIATRSLYAEDGVGRVHELGRTDAALDSLYALFAILRDEMKAGGPTPRYALLEGTIPLEKLAAQLLNDELRPCLARWHPLRSAWNDADTDWPKAPLCRLDLEATRLRSLDYAIGFGRLAGVDDGVLAKFHEGYARDAARWKQRVAAIAPGAATDGAPHLLPLEIVMAVE